MITFFWRKDGDKYQIWPSYWQDKYELVDIAEFGRIKKFCKIYEFQFIEVAHPNTGDD